MTDKTYTLLFIEDDPFMVDMYGHVLRKQGYEIESATDGAEGLQKAKSDTYDLILLDIMMPEMLGIEVLEKLRSDESVNLDNTKIVILTNLAQSDDSRRALEAQADAYLIKADITPSKLVELLKQILSQ